MNNYNIRNYSDTLFNEFVTLSSNDLDILINSFDTDYDWVDIFEPFMQVLDNIIRNPRRFIQSEENLVPIEKAKKFTEESIKHLAQNTQLIQDIDKDGMPQPLKVLNIYKEETYDLYENRFIHSLVENLLYFLQYKYDKLKLISKSTAVNGKEVNYTSKTNINKTLFETKLNINISTENSNDKIDYDKILKKVENMYTIVLGFQSSTIMKELERSEPVRSPIRKTNAILKDPLLNKCLDLWEVLEKLQNGMELEKNTEKKFEKNEQFLEGLNKTNYLNYCILTNQLKNGSNNFEIAPNEAFKQIIKQYIRKKEITISNFRETIVKDFDDMCKTYINQYDEVSDIYDDFIDSFENLLIKI